MNIAFDAAAILGPGSKNRGIGNYALSQFRAMIQNDEENTYYFFNCFEPFNLFDSNDTGIFIENYYYVGKEYFLIRDNKCKALYGDLVKKFIKEYKIDVFYITSPFEGNQHVYEKSWFENVKVVATVYDIIPYIFKEIYLADVNVYNRYMECIDMLRWCDKCLAISESAKTDMVNKLGFSADKIDCIWGAVDDRYQQIEITINDRNYFQKLFGIKDPFIMCTGGDDHRKNIGGLIEAYSKMNKALINKYQLVIVCKLSQVAVEKYTKMILEYNVKGRVILTNFVSNDDLLKLYNMAELMAFPSQYEGFGLPVVEAFACGTPVLTSNNSSLVEIAGDAAYLVDPFNISDITRGLEEALTDVNKNQMIAKGFKRLELFNWNAVAQASIESISKLPVNNNKCTAKNKKIAVFTPLPPIQSGISDYSVDILNGLSNYFDIDVFIDKGYKWCCSLNENIRVYYHNEFLGKDDYYDIIYQMGNSEYHFYMYKYIEMYPGTVVLHDYNLHDSFYFKCFSDNKKDYNEYKKYLAYDYLNPDIDKYLNDLCECKCAVDTQKFPLNGYIVDHANKIIVHCDENKEKLLNKNIKYNVMTIRSYASIDNMKFSSETKQELGYKNDDIIIACFGHVHETKRIIPILKAYARIKKENNFAKLVLVGKLSDSLREEYEKIVREQNLYNDVLVTGYTELDVFTKYIDATDICLNLRYPYNGETSGSLMRILGKGKCVLVNDIGSFSEIPDDACVKLPNVANLSENQEVEIIYQELIDLINSPEKIEMIGVNARKYAEENLDIDIICKQYAEFIMEDKPNVITNELLEQIKNEELIPNHYTDKEIKLLSKTLAYVK